MSKVPASNWPRRGDKVLACSHIGAPPFRGDIYVKYASRKTMEQFGVTYRLHCNQCPDQAGATVITLLEDVNPK
jgi:hypothetical protein